MRQDTNYAYAVGRIRVMENRLMKAADLDALIEAGRDSVIPMLVSMGYPQIPADISGGDSDTDPLYAYSDLLSAYFSDCVRDVMRFAPEPDVIGIFLKPADYNNVKICVKNIAGTKKSGNASAPDLGKYGTVDPEMLWNAFTKNDFGGIDPVLANAAKRALEELSKSENAKNSDIIIDKAFFADMREIAYRSSFYTRRLINGYLDVYADWQNMLAALRIRLASGEKADFDKAFLSGKLKKKYYDSVLDGSNFTFSSSPYEQYVLKECDMEKTDPGSIEWIITMERLCDENLTDYFIKNKNETYKINALTAYIAAKKREISNIRIITVGKRAGLTNDEIRKIVRKI